MEKKRFKCVDNLYDFKSYIQDLKYGSDCAYRALQIQGKTNYDINFGFMLCRKSLMNGVDENFKSVGGGYCMPYAWHVWNETDDTIYDSCGALQRWGFDVCDVENVLIVDGPRIKSVKEFDKWVSRFAKSLITKGLPPVVYIQGLGMDTDNEGNWFVIGDDHFNSKLDIIDANHNITGFTETNIVKVLAD